MIKITQVKNVKISGAELSMLNYSGYFGEIESGSLNEIYVGMIFSCRESFHEEVLNKKENIRQFIFAHGGNFTRVQNFVKAIEDKLKLSARNRIKLFNIKPKYCLVQISDWWNLNNFRLQFLTILLRAGTHYVSNVDRAINSQKYFQTTKPAVNLFLDGYTKVRKGFDIYDDEPDYEIWNEKTQRDEENPDYFDSYEGWTDRLTKKKEKDLKKIFYK